MSKWDDTSGTSWLFRLENQSGTYKFQLYLVDSGGVQNGPWTVTWASPTTGKWYQIGVVYTAASHKTEFFVGDETTAIASIGSDTTPTGTSIRDTGSPFTIAARNVDGTPAEFTAAKFFLARLWSTTRTAAQLQNDDCVLLGATANLVGEWSLDNTLNDNSGNSLTLTNGGTFSFAADVPSCTSPATGSPPKSILGLMRAFWL